jgi:pectate lyase
LNDSGAGSLRACAEATGPRYCLFEVGGVITLNSPLQIAAANSYLTIAGQTAPGDGITLKWGPVIIAYGAHDVIIRHLRHRQAYDDVSQATNSSCGGFMVYGPFDASSGKSLHVSNVILDHVSVAYACDDSVQGVGYVTGVTVQWSLIGEGYEGSKGDPYGSSKGYIGQANQPESPQAQVAFHHNLIINSASRNPAVSPFGLFDYRYNLVHNWSACTGSVNFGDANDHVPTHLPDNINFVGNIYLAGPDTQQDFTGAGCWLGAFYDNSPLQIYVRDNETPWCGGSACAANAWNLGWGRISPTHGDAYPAPESPFRKATPHPAPAVTATPRASLEATLTASAGATVPKRDSLDTRLLEELRQRTTGSVGRRGAPFPTIATATAPLADKDTDKDGMPDAWEVAQGLKPNDASDGPKMARNGYTNLENYLNALAGDTIPGDEGPGPGPGPTPPEPPIVTPVPPSGNDVYVAKNGADSNDCPRAESPDTPKLTIGSALTCLTTPGKHLIIKAGVYTEAIDTQQQPLTGGTSWEQPTTIETYQNDAVTIQLPEGGEIAFRLRNGAKDQYLLIRGSVAQPLVIDAAQRPGSSGVQLEGVQHIRLEQVEVRNTVYEAVYATGTNDITWSDAFLHHAGYVGLLFDGTNANWTLERVSITSNGWHGILHKSGAVEKLVIKESTIKHNASPGMTLGASTGVQVLNSVIQ